MRLSLSRPAIAISCFVLAFFAGSVFAQDPLVTPPGARPATIVYDSAPSQNGSGLSGGIGAFIVQPRLDSNRAFNRQNVPDPNTFQSTSTDFSPRLTGAPRFWLGYTSDCGWGVRFSAWFFDQTTTANTSVDAAAPAGTFISSAQPGGLAVTNANPLINAGLGNDVLNTRSRLQTQIYDIEVTRTWDFSGSSLIVSGGVRVARIQQTYNATLFNTANDPNGNSETRTINSTQRFTGAGPTIAFEGHCPIGTSGLGLYGVGRGAILAGDYRNDANFATELIVGGAPIVQPTFSNSAPRSAVIPMSEIELGGEWTGTRGRTQPFVRLGVVAHTYFNVLNNNGGNSSLNGNLSFFGFTAAAGVRF